MCLPRTIQLAKQLIYLIACLTVQNIDYSIALPKLAKADPL